MADKAIELLYPHAFAELSQMQIYWLYYLLRSWASKMWMWQAAKFQWLLDLLYGGLLGQEIYLMSKYVLDATLQFIFWVVSAYVSYKI